MQFCQERLEYQADKGEALKHLQARYAIYLEGVLDADDDLAKVAEDGSMVVLNMSADLSDVNLLHEGPPTPFSGV